MPVARFTMLWHEKCRPGTGYLGPWNWKVSRQKKKSININRLFFLLGAFVNVLAPLDGSRTFCSPSHDSMGSLVERTQRANWFHGPCGGKKRLAENQGNEDACGSLDVDILGCRMRKADEAIPFSDRYKRSEGKCKENANTLGNSTCLHQENFRCKWVSQTRWCQKWYIPKLRAKHAGMARKLNAGFHKENVTLYLSRKICGHRFENNLLRKRNKNTQTKVRSTRLFFFALSESPDRRWGKQREDMSVPAGQKGQNINQVDTFWVWFKVDSLFCTLNIFCGDN